MFDTSAAFAGTLRWPRVAINVGTIARYLLIKTSCGAGHNWDLAAPLTPPLPTLPSIGPVESSTPRPTGPRVWPDRDPT
eukprot:6044356-Pyramimonas_sp.AAC.1